MKPSPPALEHLFTVDFEVAKPETHETTDGARMLVMVTGGSVYGPKISGTVVAGRDWALRKPDGVVRVDVRAELRTNEGDLVLMTYRGVATPVDAGVRILVTPSFEVASTSTHEWLNRTVTVAVGSASPGAVSYDVFEVK